MLFTASPRYILVNLLICKAKTNAKAHLRNLLIYK